ncbi:hypothetical protein LIER_15543 [Lithospermum erythrorhizon]|uniref:Gag-pol polyprotein n=1 Tax=Lithospermum erythrorhizon TaxID=34254 RepID=A0AAV3Q4X8_LITER
MESFKEGGSISRPPLLDGSNYGYWKAKMTAFLQDEAALANHKALNAIFNAVDINIFKLINTRNVAKVA